MQNWPRMRWWRMRWRMRWWLETKCSPMGFASELQLPVVSCNDGSWDQEVVTRVGLSEASKRVAFMSEIEKSERECTVCGGRTQHQRKKKWTAPNIATAIATLGLWALRPGENWQCCDCGSVSSDIFCLICRRTAEQTRLTEHPTAGSLWQCSVCSRKHRYRTSVSVGAPPIGF